LSRQCAGITREGRRCARLAEGPNGYCWLHDPKHAEERRNVASRAGKARPSKEVADLKIELKALKDDVLEGRVDRNDAAVAAQVYRVLKDLIELERRVKETDELARQIEELKREYGIAG
jgi:hypothetical protein